VADWYVYQNDKCPRGPLSTEGVVEAILNGTLSTNDWIAGPDGTRWLRVLDVPIIADQLRPADPSRRR
jgi:hypothetical protein